jgi:hypothetical protein
VEPKLESQVRAEILERIAKVGPKRSLLPLRVVLLGESAAAGWLYAPEVTPAKMLAAELERASGPRVFEVIDLAAIDVGPEELLAIAETALELVPDLFVVFAGNNWPVRLPIGAEAAPADFERATEHWSEQGFAGVARSLLAATRALSERVLERLSELFDRGSAQAILVVPEVNLIDWHRSRPVAWLGGDSVRTWHALAEQARAALRKEEFAAAACAAQRMTELDSGTNPTSQRLLAIARQGLGDVAGCRAACEAEVEARSFDNYPSMPGATREIQRAIRLAAERHELELVDLPALFAAAANGDAPGRRFFLDYCHLTVEAMELAAKAVASAVLRASDPETPRAIVREGPALEVPPVLDARAKFLTGLCTAHWSGRETPSLAPLWFDLALRASPAIAGEMATFLAGRAVPAELMHLSRAEQELDSLGETAGRRMRHTLNLDAEVIEWLIDSLERARAGFDRNQPIAELIGAHGVNAGGVDLSAPHFHHQAFAQLPSALSALAPEPGLYLRALWPRFEHTLIASGSADLLIELTARLPPADEPRQGELRLELNQEFLRAVELEERWSKHAITIERRRLRHGINRLCLIWPAVSADGDRALARVAHRWRNNLPEDMHPTFGELLALTARTSAAPPAQE